MDKEKKHGGLAVLLGIGKPKDEMGGGEGLDASGEELADILGVAPEKRESFKSALHSYVTQCAGHEEPDTDDEEY